MPNTLALPLLNTRSLQRHATGACDFRLMNNDVLFLTETQLSSESGLDETRNLIDKFRISFKLNNHSFSSVVICYQNPAYISER